MTGHIIHALAKRGVAHVRSADPKADIEPREMIPVIITAVVAALIIFSIDYTIGQVMASLAMIESPSRTAIIESKPPPPYADEPDAPLEKESLLATSPDTDVEVTVIDHKPITAKISTTIAHLHRIGGFRARWRGLGVSFVYHFLHSLLANFLAAVFGFGIIGEALSYIFVSLGLARLHMAWTHRMIAYPSTKSFFQRMPARKDCKALLLPSLAYAAAQQATIILPLGVFLALEAAQPMHGEFANVGEHHDCSKVLALTMRVLAVPFTYLLVAFSILLPAAVTLTRIEASLLPEGEETIVPFDKANMVGDIDVTVRGGCRALFVEAWRSFDRSSRLRVIKLYAKMILAQVAVVFVAVHLIVAELYVIGGERIAEAIKSGAAQLKQMAHEAQEAKSD